MASGKSHSRHQQGIIKRYYETADTRVLQRLAELVSDLYMCETEKKADKLWATAEKSLTQAKLKPERVAKIIASRDVSAFAAVVGELSG